MEVEQVSFILLQAKKTINSAMNAQLFIIIRHVIEDKKTSYSLEFLDCNNKKASILADIIFKSAQFVCQY